MEKVIKMYLFLFFIFALQECKPSDIEQQPVPCSGPPGPDEVCIPGGTFIMGHERIKISTNKDFDDIYNDFDPPHKVRLSPFFMDKYEVTNGEYKLCVDAGVCKPLDSRGEIYCGGELFIKAPEWDDPVNANVPCTHLVGVQEDFKKAETYCRWMGKRLPTEAEWERAARGPKSFDYPWGNEQADCNRLPYLHGCKIWYLCEGAPTEVPPRGSAPGDVSVEGVFDLNGSVSELVQDLMDANFYSKSPLDNPVNLTPEPGYYPQHIARGDDFVGSGARNYDGHSGFPQDINLHWKTVPSWIRHCTGNFGGFRCVRDDGKRLIEREFIEFRNKIIKGRLLP